MLLSEEFACTQATSSVPKQTHLFPRSDLSRSKPQTFWPKARVTIRLISFSAESRDVLDVLEWRYPFKRPACAQSLPVLKPSQYIKPCTHRLAVHTSRGCLCSASLKIGHEDRKANLLRGSKYDASLKTNQPESCQCVLCVRTIGNKVGDQMTPGKGLSNKHKFDASQ
eukprot:666594-Pelagomonas_calceolata.AAC.2